MRSSVSRDNVVVVLLAWKALQLRHSVTSSSSAYVPGSLNCLADDASRIIQPLSDLLVAFFNSNHP